MRGGTTLGGHLPSFVERRLFDTDFFLFFQSHNQPGCPLSSQQLKKRLSTLGENLSRDPCPSPMEMMPVSFSRDTTCVHGPSAKADPFRAQAALFLAISIHISQLLGGRCSQ